MGDGRPASRRLPEWVVCTVEGHERFCPQRLYDARRELRCSGCGRTLAEGERFTIHKPGGAYSRSLPLCGLCVPFRRAEGYAEGTLLD